MHTPLLVDLHLKAVGHFLALIGPQTLRESNLRAKAENFDIPISIAQNSDKNVHKIHEKESPEFMQICV